MFEEDKGQLDVFEGTGVVGLVEGVMGKEGGEGRDGLLATLGVTGSGKVGVFFDSLLRTSLPRGGSEYLVTHEGGRNESDIC